MNRLAFRSSLLAFSFTLLCMTPHPADAQPSRDQANLDRARANAKQMIWWNQDEKIDKLNLTVEQRELMDAKLDEYFEKRDAMDPQAFLEKYRGALKAGDFEQARALVEPTADAYNAPMIMQMTLSIEVLSLLDPGQMEAFRENFPGLLERPWVRLARFGNRGGGLRSRAGGQRQGGGDG